MPPYFQCFVTSATLGKDMRYIKDFLCVRESNMQALSDSVVILRLKEPPLPDSSQLTHYVIKVRNIFYHQIKDVFFLFNLYICFTNLIRLLLMNPLCYQGAMPEGKNNTFSIIKLKLQCLFCLTYMYFFYKPYHFK